jgi:predicted peptidase
MAKTIPQELKDFKTTVEPGLSSMNQACTTLTEKLTEVISATDSAKSGVDSNYNSSNKASILASFASISEVYNKIKTSISSDLQQMLTESQAIIDIVTELEKLITEIEAEEEKISKEYNKDSPSYSVISEARDTISKKESEFDTKSNEATTKLAALKSKDSSLSFVSDFGQSASAAASTPTGDLQYGSFELKTFTDSQGHTISYYLYVPSYGGQQVEGLPVMLYMHGGSSKGTSKQSWNISGLTRMIKGQEITPSGIVIMPYIKNFEGDNVEQTLKELTDSVVSEYKADSNRISVSGHSYGGVTTYKMVNKYPNYFAAAVPISGSCEVTSSFQNVKVWAFNGTKESGNRTSPKAAQKAINSVNSVGGQGYLTLLKASHSQMNQNTYKGTYTSPDGEEINPLEWAFKQTKKT